MILNNFLKKITILAVVFTMLLSSFPGGIKQKITHADGHIEITTWEGLHNVRNNLSASYILMNNLSSSDVGYATYGADWTPIGCGSLAEAGSPTCASGGSQNAFFTGDFNGNNMVISDLISSNGTNDYVGFFGATNTGANIYDLTFNDLTISGDVYVGGLVGRAYFGTINNVHITGNSSISGGYQFVGGLIGNIATNIYINNSSSSANITGQFNLGGLVGELRGTLTNSYSTGNITATGHTVGGLIGKVRNAANITFSYATGNVFGTSSVGGLIGVIDVGSGGEMTVEYSYATGDATNTDNQAAAGFIGSAYSGGIKYINNSYSRGNVYPNATGIWYNGGFIGTGTGSIITNSYSTGLVSQVIPNFNYGGFVANGTSITCSNSFWDVQTSGTSQNVAGCAATSKTTAEMTTFNTFTDANWNFSSVWGINPSVNGGYPFLRFQGFDSLPFISTLSPVNNAIGVAVDANLVITFTEAVNVGTGNINIYKTSDSSLVEAIVVTSEQVTGTGTATITINPTDSLEAETEYYVLIDATAFDDLIGNSFAGIADTTAWSFTSADITPPTVVTLSPANNTTEVAVDANLVITFTEAVNVGTGNINIYKTSDSSLVEAIGVTSGQVTGTSTAIITIDPTDSLENDGTQYYVLIDATAFTDLAGNPFAGIVDTTAWSFTSLDIIAPEISNPLPSGEKPSGTTLVTLSVSTNEIAICKYSETSGTAFADMTAFSSTGAMSHSADVSVSDGVSYDYYVICQDASLNESIEVAISFSVEETPASAPNTRTSSGSTLAFRQNFLAQQALLQQQIIQEEQKENQVENKYIFTKLLKQGANNSEVFELQKYLNTTNYASPLLIIDGKFGPLTRAVVINFQLANKLVGDGIIGPLTRAVLNK